ncbi:hypothetical protein SKAU_G00378480 [Synaphobranchus kaupii]|uniref:Gap junction protein n=1 Tax=Synaphobranchus kaupii TaxID=118154 RepID=A0A9Q1ICE8_SYNKA|nr:hypothetical protein SKAU_G00378480 [Synaphobranchus kaupii]
MGRPGAMEVVFVALSRNITIVGKCWLLVLVVLRGLSLLMAGYPLYWDEQERFVCNTAQPGCANACFDAFSPLSLLRFWPVQLLIVSLPLAVFSTHVVHVTLSAIPAGTGSAPLLSGRVRGQDFACVYLAQVLIRIGLEAGFAVAHYRLFGVRVPRRFLCGELPCTSTVECFTSRPTEKTAILGFTLGLNGLSLLLSAIDLACAVCCCVRRRRERAMKMRTDEEEEHSLRAEPSFPQTQSLHSSAATCKRRASQSGVSKAGSAHVLEAGGVAAGSEGETESNSNNPGAEGMEGEGGGAEPGLTVPVGTPRPARSSVRSDLRPPPSPRPGGRPAGGVGTPRAHRTTQRPLLDTPENSDSPERRAWV